MNSIVHSMNDILSDWKKQFDIFNAISFVFTVKDEFLYFGTCEVCRLSNDEVITYAEFDANGLQIILNERHSIVVSFRWPEDQPPEVSYIACIRMMKDSDPILL